MSHGRAPGGGGVGVTVGVGLGWAPVPHFWLVPPWQVQMCTLVPLAVP